MRFLASWNRSIVVVASAVPVTVGVTVETWLSGFSFPETMTKNKLLKVSANDLRVKMSIELTSVGSERISITCFEAYAEILQVSSKETQKGAKTHDEKGLSLKRKLGNQVSKLGNQAKPPLRPSQANLVAKSSQLGYQNSTPAEEAREFYYNAYSSQVRTGQLYCIAEEQMQRFHSVCRDVVIQGKWVLDQILKEHNHEPAWCHEVKTVVIQTIWDQERSQGVVVRRDLDRSSTNQFSFCRPLPQLMDALMEEVNSCHDVKLVVILLGKKCSALLNLAKLPQS
ncbi:hypothetical protein F2Q68_00022398 [Brassica cretica]|uniref:Uncharacterized protein n=1 Tax=Brassica cretica TaxID=69181 RepID=A0A8S9FTN6_BRACR|nr:hypothetical protein F2Q68_00022398 [Brassica cretica]